MELLYVWIEDYNNIKRQGFNFSPKHHFHFEPNEKEGPVTGGTLTHNPINPNYPDNFFGDHISNITAIVGKNGSGKSSLIKAIGEGWKNNQVIIYKSEDNITITYFCASELEIKNNTGLTIRFHCNEDYRYNIIYYSPFINSNITPYSLQGLGSCDVSNNHLLNSSLSTTSKLRHFCAEDMDRQINFIYSCNSDVIGKINLPEDINIEISYPFDHIPQEPNTITKDFIETILNKNFNNFLKSQYKSENSLKYSDPYKDRLVKAILDREYTFKKSMERSTINISIKIKDLKQYLPNGNNDLSHIIGILFTWRNMSDGEATFLSLFARLWEALKADHIPAIILLDEFELGLHPQWQKEAIGRLIKFFELININKHHLILTSHSPFLVSDLPRENVIFLNTEKDEKGKPWCKVCEPHGMERTFGANIHSLYRSSFFMDGLMGKFAEGKINDVIKDLRENGEIIEGRKKEIHYIIDMVGEPIIRNQLRKMYNEKFHKYDSLDERIAKLENEIAELKNRRNDTN